MNSTTGGKCRSRESYSFVWKYALVVFLIALAFRGVYLAEASQRPDFNLFYMDEEYHLEWARSLANDVWNSPYDQLRDAPYFRAPLYPYFLAGLLSLLGGSAAAVRIVQILLGSVSCVLTYGIATRVFGQRVGLVAGLLCSLYWVLAYFDTQLLMPVLLVFLVLTGMFIILLATERRNSLLAALAGLVFGLCSITRPNILVFFPFLLWWAIAVTRREEPKKGRWFTILLVAGLVLPPTLVTLRNRLVGEDWVFIASQGGVNFYIGNNLQSNGMQAVVPGTRQTWWGGFQDTKDIAEEATGRDLRPSEISDYWFQRSFEYIRDYPAGWLWLTLRKMGAYVGNIEIPNNEPYEAYRSQYTSLRSIPLCFSLLFGLFLVSVPFQMRFRKKMITDKEIADRTRGNFVVLMLSLVGVYSLTVIAFFVTGRYRVPMLPFFAIGASVTIVSIYDLLRKRVFVKTFVIIGITIGIITLLSIDYLGIRQATSGFVTLTMAQDRLDTGDIDGAIDALEKLLQEDLVRVPGVHLILVRSHLRRDSPEDRIAAFQVAERGLMEYPEEPELLWYSAVGYASQKNWVMVRQRITRFLEFEPDNIRAFFLGFTASQELGDIQAAQMYLDLALAVDRNNPIVIEMQNQLRMQTHPLQKGGMKLSCPLITMKSSYARKQT